MGSDPASVMPDHQSDPCCSSSTGTATRNSPHIHPCHCHCHCRCPALPQGPGISPKNESPIQGGGGVREAAYGLDDKNGK